MAIILQIQFKLLLKKLILLMCIISYLGIIFSSDFSPEDQKNLNYRQIFFRWPQISGDSEYELIISDSILFSLSDTIAVSSNSYLLEDMLSWNSTYYWKVCKGSSECLPVMSFTVNPLPLHHSSNINILYLDQDNYEDGINILDCESLGYSLAIDMHGETIWFADKYQFNESKIIVTQFLDNGNIIGFSNGIGYEFTIDSEILFQTPVNLNVHHQISKTDNSTYFLLDAEIEYHDCPNECDEEFSYFPVPWQGDRFVEISETGEILWMWDTFQKISLDEYNPYYASTYNGTIEFDWTHSNSLLFDPISNSVLASIRNLSRITSIDYDTGETNWSIGKSEFMQNPDFENEIDMSQQHSAQLTDEGNLILFDNGSFQTPELSRCLEVEFNYENEPFIAWEHVLPDSLFTGSRGECDRLHNGNTLITAGRTGHIIEVNNENELIWHLKVTDNHNNDISVYRTERVKDLYPENFSYEIEGLTGLYPNFSLTNTGLINCVINNMSWALDSLEFQLKNMDSNILLSGKIALDSSVVNYQIDIDNISTYDSLTYNLSFISNNNNNNKQSINFSFIDTIMGDLNNDFEVNIADVLIIIAIIIDNQQITELADVNSDGNIDIFDLIIIMNIVLHN